MNTNYLYGRSYRLTFYDDKAQSLYVAEDLFYDDSNALRISFDIQEQIGGVNNIAKFQIYNPSLATQNLLVNARSVIFEIGFSGNLSTLYKGTVSNILCNRDQPAYIYSIFCIDYIINYTPVNIISSPNDTPLDIIEKIAIKASLNVEPTNLQQLPTTPIGKALSFTNMSYQGALQKLGQILNVTIWVAGYTVYSYKDFDPTVIPEVTLNFMNGMIGSPQYDVANAGVNVQSLINPQINVGNYIKIETLSPDVVFDSINFTHFDQSVLTNGSWLVKEIRHVGDNRQDGLWTSFISGFSYNIVMTGLAPS